MASGTRDRPRVCLLTNFVAPYRVPVLRALAERVGALRVLVSTPMESNREWAPEWEGLDVVVQRTVTVPRWWKHPSGFRERIPLHVPVDTWARLNEIDPDVVISGEFGARTLLAAWWCARRRRPLVIWATLSERTEQGRSRLRVRLRRYLLGRAAAVMVNGESGARYIRSLGYDDDRIHRVPQASPTGCDGPIRREEGGPLRLVYVGRLVELKGIDRLVDGLESWCGRRRVPVELTLVGPGDAGSPAGERADGFLVVRRTGPVPPAALPERYRAADALVFPTLADEWGLVVNEAMSCGLPVLGSVHSQAVMELVEDGATGWLYDPERPAQLGAALDRIAEAGKPGVRAMGRTARDRVWRLTPETMAEAMAAIITRVAGEAIVGDRRRT